MVTALAVSLLLPKQYAATASVVVDIKSRSIAGVVMPGMAMPSYMATQLDIINSQRVAPRRQAEHRPEPDRQAAMDRRYRGPENRVWWPPC